jgi:hypothetical protein
MKMVLEINYRGDEDVARTADLTRSANKYI